MKWLALLFLGGVSALAADDASRIADLERRLQDLDQKYRALEERVGEKPTAKPSPAVSIGATGIAIQSADSNFVAGVHALFQFDTRWFFDGGPNDTLALRRIRPFVLEGTFFKDVDFLMVPEFGNARAAGGVATANAVSIQDAYLNYRVSPAFQVRAGKFKSPVGLEQLQSDPVSMLVERSMVSDVTPNRDLGIMLHGDVMEGMALYAVGLFNGVSDNANSANIDFDDQKEVAGRVFVHPFHKTDLKGLKGLGLGIGASLGTKEGAGGVAPYTTETLTPFFSYSAGAAASGRHYRWTPQAYNYCGPFELMAEYAVSSQEVRLGTARGTMDHKAWQVTVGYVLTGENASYKGIVPNHPFDLAENKWGAFEAVARYSELDIDDQAFAGFASAAGSATRAAAFTVGMNWYLNRNLRSMVNYVHTDFKGGAGSSLTARDESAVLTRFQLVF